MTDRPLARESVRASVAYQPPLEGRASMVRLDFNESSPPGTLDQLVLERRCIEMYPEYDRAVAMLSVHWGIDRENLLLCNGSSEGIMLVSFCFTEPGRTVAVVARPTFALIPHYLRIAGALVTEVDVDPACFELPLGDLERALEGGAGIVFLASPDNPTGAVVPVEWLEDARRRFPGCLFVLDQAYAEYVADDPCRMLHAASAGSNLLVLRTFSKAWGLAGLRIGAVVGNGNLIGELSKLRTPYSVNAAAVGALCAVISDAPSAPRRGALETARRRDRLVDQVRGLGLECRGSPANFVLIELGGSHAARAFCDLCRSRALLVRDRSDCHGMEGVVRASVGPDRQNELLLDCIGEYLKAGGMT
ncbi:histidinol-phosphate aminotransferase family protein [Candidatus Fermentibacterales bacterium]|nr:histidinol-phosphate aminotransferase family protein [Candidatus Fermentibacterales bacterium]